MSNKRARPSDDEWLRADQPGPPLRSLVQQRRGLVLGALVLALLLAIVVAGRPAVPLAKPAAIRSPAPTGTLFFGLFPVFAYDAGHRQIMLLNFRDQTWLWSNNQWAQARPPVAPPRRTGAAVAWDPGMHAVLLFGGQAYGDQTRLNDTWAWDGSSWSEVGTGYAAPPASLMSGTTYDWDLHEMVLVQSDIHFGAPIQMWTWTGVAWRPRNVSGGPTSPVAAIAYDPRSRTVLAIAGGCAGFECRSQTWSWDGTTWHQLTPAHEPGFAFYSMAMVPDPRSGRLLLVTVSPNTLGPAPTETWSWDGRDWAGLQLVGQPGAEVRIVAATGDNVAGQVFAFQDLSQDFNTLRINAWQWTGDAWSPIDDTTAPSSP
jgi:hypothetical protein